MRNLHVKCSEDLRILAIEMTVNDCPQEECPYRTPDVEAVIRAIILMDHLQTQHAPAAQAPAWAARAEVKKPDRLVIKEDSTDQDWVTFVFKWGS